jgi:hypothetical protein
MLTLRITGFVDFVHSPGFSITRKYNVSEIGSFFPSSGEGREMPTLLGPLENGNLNQSIQ